MTSHSKVIQQHLYNINYSPEYDVVHFEFGYLIAS